MKASDIIEWQIMLNESQEYSSTVQKMEKKVNDIIYNAHKESAWLLEHQHVYTAGSSACDNELLNKNNNVPVFPTGRGGKYTYHGPGQLIGYFMLDIEKRINKDIRLYLRLLEKMIISVLDEFSIKGETHEGRTGIWVQHEGKEKKIAAIGIRIKKYISLHGIAINVHPDLNYFKGIVPCGLDKRYGVTSIKEFGITTDTFMVAKTLKQKFLEIFTNEKMKASYNTEE